MSIEELSRKLHDWYLEATARLHPESYNPKAQKGYDELSEEQKSIDRYIAEKILSLISDKGPEVDEEFVEKWAKDFSWMDGSMTIKSNLIQMLREAGVRMKEEK